MNLQDALERTASAGEYVLGTLTPSERDTFEAQLRIDRELQAEVYAWQDRFLNLHAHTAPMVVRPDLWSRIARRLGTGRPPVVMAPAANDPFWRRTRFWQVVSGLAVAASVVMGTVLVTIRQPDSIVVSARYLAVLQAPDRTTTWVVEAAAGGDVRLIPVGAMPVVPAGKAMEFWTKPEGAAGPTSLGLVQAGQTYVIPASRLPALGQRQLFELTMEPANGSPIGRPTGPILAVGKAVAL